MDILYSLSKIVPVPMKSTYQIEIASLNLDDGTEQDFQYLTETCSWWQWRSRVFNRKVS